MWDMLGLEGAAYSTPQGLPPLLVSGSYSHTALASLAIMSTAYLKNAPPGKMYSEGAYAALATPQPPPA